MYFGSAINYFLFGEPEAIVPVLSQAPAPQAVLDHQTQLKNLIASSPLDPQTVIVQGDAINQVLIAQLIQNCVLPLYKMPYPENPTYATSQGRLKMWAPRSTSSSTSPARRYHGCMHSARTALWTQLFRRLYAQLGRPIADNPILLALAGAYHDAGREGEGEDKWDGDSADLLGVFMDRLGADLYSKNIYIQTIKEKDPAGDLFSTDMQRIVHDADCVDVIRVRFTFIQSKLCFWGFNGADKKYLNQLIEECHKFTKLTEEEKAQAYLEQNSSDFYGDLVRFLFSMKSSYPLITRLIEADMSEILKGNSTVDLEMFAKLCKVKRC